MPCSSRSSKRWLRVRGLMLPTVFSSSQKRFGPLKRSRSIRAVHLLPIICMADAMQPTLDSRGLITEVVFITLQSIVLGLYYLNTNYKKYSIKGEKHMKLAVVTGATRPGRQTPKQSKWIVKTAQKLEDIEVEHVDLKDYPMPFFNEAISPRYNPNRKIDPAVQKWLDKIGEFEAYIFVTPEYNHTIPGELKNAFDFMTWEIQKKPAAVASHGTVSGARAALALKEVLSEGQAIVIPKFSAIHGMSELIDEEGNLAAEAAANPYGPQGQLDALLDELQWYSDALSAARER